jgi:signal transduction histidine kinase
MSIYTTIIGLVAGICIGFGALYLFVGLRRRSNRVLNLLFAVFALAYAGTLLLGVFWRQATSVEAFLAINRWDALFLPLVFTSLIWYVAVYTKFRPKWLLYSLTLFYIVLGIAYFINPTTIYGKLDTLALLTLPWGETIRNPVGEETLLAIAGMLSQLIVILYIIIACIRQFRRGERQQATLLGLGMAWFIAMLSIEIMGEAGIVPYMPLGEIGFLGIAVAASLQMANSILRTEALLENYRTNLEELVEQRTAALEASQAQLLQETRARAVAEERTRIARDLHDAVTQTIYSAALITEALPRIGERNPDEAQRNLAKLRQLLRGALAELRTLLFELRPASLESADLDTLLTQLVDAFTGRTRIPVQSKISGPNTLQPDVKVAFYRIAQESLNNVEKHARAESVTLLLSQKPDEVIMTIQDDGVGFEPDAISAENLGLVIMQERADAAHAVLNIETEPGSGTQVSLLWLAENNAMEPE